ncbi:sugar-binding domain-containing protein [uncultured Bacteroides sp.]|uniref:sugar-binding domain-containing protein n=1 Tax=uncultured Bacteroides sp. TaxID=162156 RepID=UPI00280AD93A|nr:sugar-binding domain-containing protein [uncultured Bacteroides sp.]
MKTAALLSLTLLCFSCSQQTDKIDLSGSWTFSTDSLDWSRTIELPGSMASNGLGDNIAVNTDWTGGIVDSSYFFKPLYAKYREPGNIKVPFWLQPVKYYKGKAWYKKEVVIPDDWAGKDVSLFLERCHWESRLYVDGKPIGMQNALGATHRYDLTGKLSAGKHVLMLCVDNRVKNIDPGENSHSISDHTQGNWNGVVGDMFLEVKPEVNVASVKIMPERLAKKVSVSASLMNRYDKEAAVKLEMAVGEEKIQQSYTLKPGMNQVTMSLPLKGDIQCWDEFSPALYDLKLSVKEEESGETDVYTDRFGFRDVKVADGKLTINGRQLFLRGTLDCAAFPKTGFPPTDVESWKKNFAVIKAHGLNHVRFHSWCPPEAAFEAADEMGLYLEIECSSWANQSTTIGDGGDLDRFIWEESERIVREFGNHPSFCMMMYGNEPAGEGSNAYLTNFVTTWKKRDARRLYCSGAGWPNLPVNDFLSDSTPRIQAWGQGVNSIINAQAPRTDYDWSDYIGRFQQPMVSHEIGQWCVYPNFKEMAKYDGVMRPRNFEIFQETLAENGMANLADSFMLASGKLQALCYKADIEAALRTKDFGGFQLLGLSDFPGQGTALVGVLDVFWEEKGYIRPEEYRRFCNTTVPLLRLPKLIYTNQETLKGSLEVAHFGAAPLQETSTSWTLKTKDGKVVASGKLAHRPVGIGNCIPLGQLEIPLDKVAAPSCLTLEATLGAYSNSWHIWVYPSDGQKVNGDDRILMTDRLDAKALQRLQEGGCVLLSLRKGSLPAEAGGEVQIGFSSIFWNTAWTLGQAPHTLGILCNPAHPALSEFPTEYYSDYQWWDAMSHSGAIEIAKIDKDLHPIVRVIDDWFTNRPLALLFEAKVGKGKLLVSGIDFWQDMSQRTEARQLLYSLKKYMCSDRFQPTEEVDVKDLHILDAGKHQK